MIGEYRALIESRCRRVSDRNLDAALALALADGDMRGYGLIKDAAIREYRDKLTGLVAALDVAAVAVPRAIAA